MEFEALDGRPIDLVFLLLSPEDGAPTARVRVFLRTEDGALWMGTNGAGLMRFQDGRFSAVTEADGLPSSLIRSLYQDRDGWLLHTAGRDFTTYGADDFQPRLGVGGNDVGHGPRRAGAGGQRGRADTALRGQSHLEGGRQAAPRVAQVEVCEPVAAVHADAVERQLSIRPRAARRRPGPGSGGRASR